MKNIVEILCSEGLKIELSGTGNISEIQLLIAGNNYSEKYGVMTLTEQDFDLFISNFENDVREIQLQVNYDHMLYSGEASGWIKKIFKRTIDGQAQLWAEVEWTDEAANKIRKGKYKYISSEFLKEYTHSKTGKKYKNVFTGAALTNVPVMKGMQQVSASEGFGIQYNQLKKMEKKTMKKTELISELSENHGINVIELQEAVKKADKLEKDNKELSFELSESKRNLSESEKKVVELSEKVKTHEQKLFDAEYTKEIEKAQAEGKITKVEAEGSFRELAETNWELAKRLLNERTATINTVSKGHDSSSLADKTPHEQIVALAESKMKADRELTFEKAYEDAKYDNPDIASKLKVKEA